MLTKDQVKHVAKLAKLSFTDDELSDFTNDFGRIIEMVEQLEEVDTEGVKPTYHGNQLVDVMRDDIAIERNKTKELLSNAPESDGRYIKVPAILESGEV
ncbi:Asp-tRNA(Asn)/Glu-tRNA(Gln) amidotransferase subunit GatC [Aerococcaceae bacterium WGS1372]